MITSTASCAAIRLPSLDSAPGPYGTPAARRSPGSPARRPVPGPGTGRTAPCSDSTSSIRASGAPRQKCSPAPKARCGLGSRSGSKVSASAKTAGSRLAAPSSAAIFWPSSTTHSPDLDVRGRRALEELERGVEAQHLLDRQRPGPRRAAGHCGASRATSPLPNTFTEASWPALSRSTTAATSSSSLSPAAEQVGGQVVPGRRRGARPRCSRTRSANSVAATHGGVHDARRGRRLVHPHDRLRPAAQRRHVGAGEPDQLGDDQDGQRLGVLPDDVEAARVDLVEQRGGQRLHPRPQPLDVAAVERAGDRAPQPGVLGRLVLHHLVAVQQVERLEVVARLPVAPDPAERAVAQHRRWRRRARRSASCRSARARRPRAGAARAAKCG